jgi:hypothetical protein
MRTFVIVEKEFLNNTIEAYSKQNLNEARQAAEAFAKLVILKEFGDTEGEQIITNSHSVITEYSFDGAIASVLFKNKIKNNQPLIHKKVKSYLQVLQNHGNMASHNDDFSKLDLNDNEYTLYHLTKLIKFFYEEYTLKIIPNNLDVILGEYENQIHEKIEQNNLDWLNIQKNTNDFSEQQQRFVLITDKCENTPILSNLSNITWSYIGDFDKNSNFSGLHLNLKDELNQYRDVNLITLDDKIDYSKSTTFWEFLNGYSERDTTLTSSFRIWQKQYIHSNKIKKHTEELYNGGISTSDIFIFIFWENEKTLKYLFDYLSILDDIFTEATNLIFMSTKEDIRLALKEELNEYENINNFHIHNLSIEVFSILLKNKIKINKDDILLPALIEGQESSIKIEPSEFIRYKDDIKVFPYNYVNNSVECNSYYKGQPINFTDLNNECDIKRNIGLEIESTVRNRLKNRNNQLIYLISDPSGGTTTIVNRILWNIREEYPSFELLNYKKQNTFEFFQKIYTETNKPILIFADHKIHEENIKKLVGELNTKRITYIILYVNRFLDSSEALKYKKELEKTQARLPFIITESLLNKENDSFYRKFANKFFNKQDQLLELKNSIGKNSPFKYSFTVFLDRYENLNTYVAEKLDDLNDFQKNRTKYLAFIQYYTGLDVTVKFLTKKIGKYSLYSESKQINNLLVYEEFDDELKIEFIHNIICEKVLENLSGVTTAKAWKQKLVDMGMDFLSFIETEHKHNKNNYVIKDIIDRLFIKRNITTYDSENRGSIKYYTDYIEDLNSTYSAIDAREQIFKKLIELYPDNKHYLAHLGRFYSVDRNNLPKSLEYINQAIELAEEEGKVDSILYHIKGTSYSRALTQCIRKDEDVISAINLGKKAAECFETSRENDTQVNNHYPFVSQAQMLLSLLRYGKKKYSDNIYKFIEAHNNDDFVSNIIDNIENLISDYEVIREKSDDYSNMKKIKTELWELQGDIGKSLEMLNNLLSKNTYYNPVIRRNIVRLNVKKYKENINEIPEKQIHTLLSHLRMNLDGFSLEESNSTDLLLWLRLIRHKSISLDILDILDILYYIKTILDEEESLNKVQKSIQIIILYYLHIMKFIQFNKGNNDAFDEFIELKKELKNKSMFLDGKSIAREWLHNEEYANLKKVINWYDKRLTWIKEDKFFNKNSERHLEVCKGIIKEIKSQKTGVILYKNIDIHFIPRTEFTSSDLNKEVEFYLSFSYDEMSAWKVIKV